MPRYDDARTIREARTQYFAANGLGDGGYEARWVKLQAGPIPIYFLNTAARVRAVRLHDIHHVVTAYDTTWTGEGEIAAWEIASGCARHYPAWVLNLGALAIGLALNPGAMFRAFVRGRRSANLYRRELDDTLLAQPLSVLRRELRVDSPVAAATVGDRVTFAVWASAGVATLLSEAALAAAPLAAGLALLVRWL